MHCHWMDRFKLSVLAAVPASHRGIAGARRIRVLHLLFTSPLDCDLGRAASLGPQSEKLAEALRTEVRRSVPLQ